eukprot:46939-Eustigmatos_ZCMA.PRE.1
MLIHWPSQEKKCVLAALDRTGGRFASRRRAVLRPASPAPDCMSALHSRCPQHRQYLNLTCVLAQMHAPENAAAIEGCLSAACVGLNLDISEIWRRDQRSTVRFSCLK